jgi:hypothetical protein
MALTKSLIADTVFGDVRCKVYNIDPDAAATAFATGLNTIKFSQVSIKSAPTIATNATTFQGVFSENEDVSGTAVAGTLAMTSVVTSTVYRVVVYGSS